MPGDSLLSIQEYSYLLESLGLEPPVFSNLAPPFLDQLLVDALDEAQMYKWFTHGKDISQIPRWTDFYTVKKFFVPENYECDMTCTTSSSPLLQSTQMILETLATLELGPRRILMDFKNQRIIMLNIVDILNSEKQVPMLVVEYAIGGFKDGVGDGAFCLVESEVYTLLCKLLELNMTRTPQGQAAIGSLCNKSWCVVCGRPSSLKCGGCHNSTYCNRDCQKKDWKLHKSFCKQNVVDNPEGQWITINVVKEILNATNRTSRLGKTISTGDNAFNVKSGFRKGNIHGNWPFIVKISSNPSNGVIMIIDRTKSFQGRLDPQTDPEILSRLKQVIKSGYPGQRVYLWAKYVGKRSLRIRLDAKPEQRYW